jgi:prepilin-type N-terminal cleavage/methylation domain-containing protein
MRRWNWQDARGLSLVEMLIVVAVLSLVTGAVFSIFTVSLQAYWKGDLGTQVQQGSRIALDRMTRDLRQARHLVTGSTQGGFAFNINGGLAGCPSAPQISFVLPHFGSVTLSAPDQLGNSTIYMTDPNGSGLIPYDGYYVSYYLAASPGSTTLNGQGPYLEKTVYDINGTALSTVTIASNITGLTFSSGGGCPAAASREVTVRITASQTTVNQSATDVVTMDITLRNQ